MTNDKLFQSSIIILIILIAYIAFTVHDIRNNYTITSNDLYTYQRDTIALSPTLIMFDEIRFINGHPVDTTNIYRRDISEFED